MYVCALCAVIVVQQILHTIERRDLYNRIMCRDINDYKGRVVKEPASAHKQVLDRWRNKEGDDN